MPADQEMDDFEQFYQLRAKFGPSADEAGR